MKKCSKCGQWKLISEFYKNKTGKYGVGAWCKECKKKYNKKYLENNEEYQKIYYENNKERMKNYQREYVKNDNNYKRKSIGISLNQHKRKGYNIVVTIDECMEMDNDYCFYCGCPLEWEYGTGFTNCSPTIDRLNNENTLTKDNIVFACRQCNVTKLDRSLSEFIQYCKMITEKFEGDN